MGQTIEKMPEEIPANTPDDQVSESHDSSEDHFKEETLESSRSQLLTGVSLFEHDLVVNYNKLSDYTLVILYNFVMRTLREVEICKR